MDQFDKNFQKLWKQRVSDQENLRKSLVRTFCAYDTEMGKESSLNCLDISQCVEVALDAYLELSERRINNENKFGS